MRIQVACLFALFAATPALAQVTVSTIVSNAPTAIGDDISLGPDGCIVHRSRQTWPVWS